MFFLNKGQFDRAIDSAVRNLRKSSRSLIEDEKSYQGGYVERELTVSYEDMWQMYMRNDWVRACVDKISKSVSNAKLIVTPLSVGQDEEPTDEAKRNAEVISNLLDDPNTGLESWKDIRKEYLRDVLIYDAGGVEIVYDKDGLVAELYSLPGERIRLNVDEHGNFANEDSAFILQGGYYNGKNVKDIPFKKDEVVYLVANPKAGSVYGLSPLESLYMSVTSDLYASKFNSDFFKNNAEASGVIGLEGMDEKDLDRFRSYWMKATKGKPHKVVAINNKVSWTPIGVNNRDMQFMEYQRWLLCKIMTVYGMQPIVLGVIDPTTGKLNSEEQLQAYREETIRPLVEMECYQLTKVLVQQGFGFDNVKIEYEPIDITDQAADVANATALVAAGIITPNEARRMYLGLNEIEGGDNLLGQQPTSAYEESPYNVQYSGNEDEIIDSNNPKYIVQETPIEEYDDVEKKVVRRGTKWCVVHAHAPKNPNDKPIGTPIKCFATKEEAMKMHQAIIISEARAAGELKSKNNKIDKTISDINKIIEKLK